jgi:hypothetical protein
MNTATRVYRDEVAHREEVSFPSLKFMSASDLVEHLEARSEIKMVRVI